MEYPVENKYNNEGSGANSSRIGEGSAIIVTSPAECAMEQEIVI